MCVNCRSKSKGVTYRHVIIIFILILYDYLAFIQCFQSAQRTSHILSDCCVLIPSLQGDQNYDSHIVDRSMSRLSLPEVIQ